MMSNKFHVKGKERVYMGEKLILSLIYLGCSLVVVTLFLYLFIHIGIWEQMNVIFSWICEMMC